jgi:Recombinase
MERISTGKVSGLVVSEPSRVRRSAAELGRIIEWLDHSCARFRKGLRAARGNGLALGQPGVVDNPDLHERISEMRAPGMTLQAIADPLNEEGVPTVTGGAKWRHSSVQAAAGYLRQPRVMPMARVRHGRPATRDA